mgnify:FL=1
MNDNLDYEAYLFISSKKFIISVNSESNKKIYEENLIFENEINNININQLDFFLEQNIFKIEKKLKNFLNEITIIYDLDNFIPVEISVKKNIYENIVDLNNLSHILYEAKDYCKKTIEGKRIAHMIINNYRFGDKNYSLFPKGLECNSFCLDIKFICLPIKIIRNFEKILKRYQVSLSQVICANYVDSFLSDNDRDIFMMTKKIINGHNPNEVLLIDKSPKKQGFFEKFFNFFN